MDKVNKIFVYGILKVGDGFAEQFDEVRISSKRATLKGTMISFGIYPGAILQGTKTIIGEIHEYSDFLNVLHHFDTIEGCSGKTGLETDLYHRQVVKVDTDYGQEDAWVYTINTGNPRTSTDYSKVVESGEWEI